MPKDTIEAVHTSSSDQGQRQLGPKASGKQANSAAERAADSSIGRSDRKRKASKAIQGSHFWQRCSKFDCNWTCGLGKKHSDGTHVVPNGPSVRKTAASIQAGFAKDRQEFVCVCLGAR